ncbi:hypothetical protein FHS83_000831 [Rhizomicrobium palustre]|uniref:Uncharacterized protein n=1 Tax=Rhizomicrobium palustre TaxID=189966 RepID=A0A846MVY3_9PROT|nr:hypothetical protein [Rhizomicrobium palustre]NIK87513.1 hypothetical protein [Rhizomicrobium palustre]
MPSQDKTSLDRPALDVQVIYPPQNGAPVGGPAPGVTPVPNNSGYVVMPGQTPVVVVQSPPQPAQPAAQSQPSLLVLTVAPQKEDKKEEKKVEVSSVFQRL